MIEQKALAFANMYGVLGTLHMLCELDDSAKEILQKIKKPISVCFQVKGGPCRTFHFDKNGCEITEGFDNADCKMNFSSPDKFNLMINEGKPGMPVKGTVKLLLFLSGTFTELTNRLTELLRPSEEALKDRAFFEESTLLTMYTVAGAISGLANSDSIAMISAGNTVDGDVSLGVKDKAQVTIRIKNHHFETIYEAAKNPKAIMEFADIDLAYGLFSGTVSTINEMCKGNIRLAGVLSMVDNINRILDRVSLYLA